MGIMLLMGLKTIAQQQAMYTQYMFNGLALNPAYAGSHESISATSIMRIQWVGIEGAPRTQTFTIHSPVPSKKIAIGLLFSRDELGIATQNTFYGAYAYRVEMNKGTLSLGMQGGFRTNNINYTQLGIVDPGLQSNQSGILPNFGVGAYYYTTNWYVGASSPSVIQNKFKGNPGTTELSSTQIPHYFITTGYVFELSPFVKLKPSLLFKSVSGAPLEVDVNTNIILDDKVWFGLSYRSGDAVSCLFDFQVTPQFRFGYSYDYTLSDLNAISSGSHEIMLNYRFVYSKIKIITPRYF